MRVLGILTHPGEMHRQKKKSTKEYCEKGGGAGADSPFLRKKSGGVDQVCA